MAKSKPTMTRAREIALEKAKSGEGLCRYFLLCTRFATRTVPNPVLGPVPCCAECGAKYDSLKSE